MKIITFQECRTNEGWQPVKIMASDGESFYVVLINPWGVREENICECKGYMYRGRCRHQDEADQSLCRWSDQTGPEVQTEEQEDHKICPRCGGATKTTFEVDHE